MSTKSKIKLSEAVELSLEIGGFNNGFNHFKGLVEEPINIKTKYTLNKNLKLLKNDVEFYEKERQKFFEQWGEEITEGKNKGHRKIKEEFGEEFKKAEQELQETEVEVELWKVTLSELDSVKSGRNFPMVFEYLIKEEE